MSKDNRYLYASATGENKVHVYTLVEVATVDEVSQTITGDGSDQTFTLTTTPASIDALYIQDANGKEYLPYKDYTLGGSVITFTTAPANTLSIVVRQRSYYKHTASFTGSATGTRPGTGTSSQHAASRCIDLLTKVGGQGESG